MTITCLNRAQHPIELLPKKMREFWIRHSQSGVYKTKVFTYRLMFSHSFGTPTTESHKIKSRCPRHAQIGVRDRARRSFWHCKPNRSPVEQLGSTEIVWNDDAVVWGDFSPKDKITWVVWTWLPPSSCREQSIMRLAVQVTLRQNLSASIGWKSSRNVTKELWRHVRKVRSIQGP